MNIDPNIATHIVLSDKSVISQESSNLDPTLLDKLMDNFGTLSIIYSKPPELFVKKSKRVNIGEEEEYDLEDKDLIDETDNDVLKSNSNKNVNNYNNNLNESDVSNDKTVISDFNTKNQFSGGHNNENNVSQAASTVNLIDLNDILGSGPQVSNQPLTNNNYQNLINQNNNVLSGMNFNSTSSLSDNNNLIGLSFGNQGNNAITNNNNQNNISMYNTINLQNDTIISMSPSVNVNDNSNFYSINPNLGNNNMNANNNFGDLFGTSIIYDPAQKVAVIPKMVKILLKNY